MGVVERASCDNLFAPAARRTVRVGTLFSGIGAPETAWTLLGWDFRWCAEIEAFPSAVLAQRFPHVRNLGDVTKVDWDAVEPIDLLCFGSPCQSFSVAGKRRGLDDPRGNLALFALGVARRLRPEWLVFENVPGLLSSGGTGNFGAFLGLLGECGYGFAYRILDAQYFGVPQQRRRVFVVGRAGDWRGPAAVLFEQESLHRDLAPRREAGEAPAGTLRASAARRGGVQDQCAGGLIPAVGHCLTAKGGSGRSDAESETLVAGTLRCHPRPGSNSLGAVAFSPNAGGDQTTLGYDPASDTAPALVAQHNLAPAIAGGIGVRRLMPVECERLQGFPDDYTAVSYRGKPAADGPRYKALGNSMAVPVIRWIGSRIQQVDALCSPFDRLPAISRDESAAEPLPGRSGGVDQEINVRALHGVQRMPPESAQCPDRGS